MSFDCASTVVPQLISHPVPANCSTPFWDPIGGKCLCTSGSCTFTDNSRPIGVSTLNVITKTVSSRLRHSLTAPTSLGVESAEIILGTLLNQVKPTFLSAAPHPGSSLLVGGRASSYAQSELPSELPRCLPAVHEVNEKPSRETFSFGTHSRWFSHTSLLVI